MLIEFEPKIYYAKGKTVLYFINKIVQIKVLSIYYLNRQNIKNNILVFADIH